MNGTLTQMERNKSVFLKYLSKVSKCLVRNDFNGQVNYVLDINLNECARFTGSQNSDPLPLSPFQTCKLNGAEKIAFE